MTLTTYSGPPPLADMYRFSSDRGARPAGWAYYGRRWMRLASTPSWSADEMTSDTAGAPSGSLTSGSSWPTPTWSSSADEPSVFIGGQVFGLEQPEQTDWAGELRINGNPGAEVAAVLREHDLGRGRVGVVGMTDAALAAWHLSEMQAGAPEAELRRRLGPVRERAPGQQRGVAGRLPRDLRGDAGDLLGARAGDRIPG